MYDAISEASPQQPFHWLPDSYYRLRDPALIARVAAVEASGLKGEIFPAAKLKRVNGRPAISSLDVTSVEEWDLRGYSKCEAAHDLVELVR
ncbi:MAG: hypothetical protein ACM336_02555 [Acidobacteriota bacterium]